ncbi:hypothetical protein NMY22_g8203 [Coprinellus aureogranulatus]|nr:hypothetical protein NMY22_g8203 [Coprinellus aureogranulatus]
MFKAPCSIQTGDISQNNTKDYYNHGSSTHTVNVSEGGRYSKNIEVNAGVFHHHEVRAYDPLRELFANIAVGAMHNSDERANAPRCHPATRKAVQENILSWIDDGQPNQVLWVTGPAGAGKTALMGTVSDVLKGRGRLAATFFFSSFTSSAERRSKRSFVTTLAYQLQRHPALKRKVSETMRATIHEDPALFGMSLKEQVDSLILRPLRRFAGDETSMSGRPLVIIVDGIDVCGDDQDEGSHASREDDQLEVLSALLHAIKDDAFPFRVVVASRPEHWIRHFFNEIPTAVASEVTVAEIFLGGNYSPDEDIEIFLTDRFAEISRRHRFRPFTWPSEQAIRTLVHEASGQFIYATTIIRFVDAPGKYPKEQLDILLRIRQPEGGSRPFAPLDALYTAVLKSSPDPQATVLWLKALQLLRSQFLDAKLQLQFGNQLQPSAWTIDRLFESREGQAHTLLNLPSLIFLDKRPREYLYDVPDPHAVAMTGSGSVYAFYHKSFLDFLQDPARCGAAFGDIKESLVEQWIWGRIAKVLECDGPELPIDQALLPTFKKAVHLIWALELQRSQGRMSLPESSLSMCDPTWWLELPGIIGYEGLPSQKTFRKNMFVLVHKKASHSNEMNARPV